MSFDMWLFYKITYFLCSFYVFVNMGHSEVYYLPKLDSEIKMKTSPDTVPWLGVLRLKHDLMNSTEFLSVVILIAKNFAIGGSDDISKISKKVLNSSTMVTFYNHQLVPWNTYVTNYYLHPEYSDETINTIAILKLDSDIKLPNFIWQPVRWPKKFYSQGNLSSVFSVGYADNNLVLEQEIKRVEFVKKDNCIIFYKSEGMDFKKIWPTHFNCFKVVGDNMTCVYEPGMAVAANDSGKWTLIGLGTFGPGCSLPARFIEFFPYIPWIDSVIGRVGPPKPITYSRRFTWMNEPGEDMDTKFLAILYNYTIELIPNVPKTVFYHVNNTESCVNKSRHIIYKEKGYIKLTSPIPSATVFFSVSLYDDHYDVECVKVELDCIRKSKTEIFLQRGFAQESLEPLIKEIVPPDYNGRYPDKILYLTDNYPQYMNKSVTTAWFKFNFIRTGRINVEFYGIPKPTTTTETPTTTTKITKTTRRRYAQYLNWDIYKQGRGGKSLRNKNNETLRNKNIETLRNKN